MEAVGPGVGSVSCGVCGRQGQVGVVCLGLLGRLVSGPLGYHLAHGETAC